jgi:hypothetical protein
VLTTLYGPVQIEEAWTIRNDDELKKLMRGEDIVKYITAQRIKWWGHLNRIDKTQIVRRLWNGIP